jgi:hypothetical protein
MGAAWLPMATPQQRWHTAVSTQPLETPQPLPTAFHDLARSITGRSHPPRYTTGPATRHALTAAGALGATTGSVVHLAAPPTSGPEVAAVLAHELSHVRQPVGRPRFLLSGLTGGDDDERQAVATGRRFLGGDGLSGGGLPSGLSPDSLPPMGAGIVGSLPVGREMGPVAEVATQAARAAVLEATASSGLASRLGGMGASPGSAGGAADEVSAAFDASGAGSPAGSAGAPGEPAGGGAPGGGPAGGPAGPASVVSGPGGAPAATPLDPDRVVELVQERLLREIERRGGRWVGVF